MQRKFAEALKTYRKEVYKVDHDADQLKEITKDALTLTKEASTTPITITSTNCRMRPVRK